MDAAVVGAGIAGASVARCLALRGHRVTVYERHAPGNPQGSSHGASRIVRKAYPDPFYTEIMAEGYGLWRKLEEQSGRALLRDVGLLYFGDASSPRIAAAATGLSQVGAEFEILDPRGAANRLPGLCLSPSEAALFTPEAGWVDAAGAIGASVEVAMRAGARLELGASPTREDLEKRHDRFVVCPGAWISRWAPIEVRVTLQTFAYVASPADGPVWIEDSEDHCYGFPSEPGRSSFKVGVHSPGPEVDPDATERLPNADALDRIAELARERFDIAVPSVLEAKGCLYTSTANEDFRWGELGENGFYCSACSGHGFKFGPWLGERLADFVEGRSEPASSPRFCGP